MFVTVLARCRNPLPEDFPAVAVENHAFDFCATKIDADAKHAQKNETLPGKKQSRKQVTAWRLKVSALAATVPSGQKITRFTNHHNRLPQKAGLNIIRPK